VLRVKVGNESGGKKKTQLVYSLLLKCVEHYNELSCPVMIFRAVCFDLCLALSLVALRFFVVSTYIFVVFVFVLVGLSAESCCALSFLNLWHFYILSSCQETFVCFSFQIVTH
jgi:hypothetical protein